MRIFLAGVSCVGKTTMGPILAQNIDKHFFDLDREIEKYHGMKIRPLRRTLPTMKAYRVEAAKALQHLLAQPESQDAVVSLPPSGLIQAYWDVVKKADATIVSISDDPHNILNRLIFFDKESNPKEKTLNKKQRAAYLESIKRDIEYFSPSYKKRAHANVDISGLNAEQAAQKVEKILKVFRTLH